jgi:hypothetical protein
MSVSRPQYLLNSEAAIGGPARAVLKIVAAQSKEIDPIERERYGKKTHNPTL